MRRTITDCDGCKTKEAKCAELALQTGWETDPSGEREGLVTVLDLCHNCCILLINDLTADNSPAQNAALAERITK